MIVCRPQSLITWMIPCFDGKEAFVVVFCEHGLTLTQEMFPTSVQNSNANDLAAKNIKTATKNRYIQLLCGLFYSNDLLF